MPELTLDDGTLWRNLVTPAKSKVAETLDEFRGNYLYNLADENLRRFNAEIAQVVIWDDHEVRNNWFPGQLLDDARYTEKSASVLAARARRAFLEHLPIRLRRGRLGRIYRRSPSARCSTSSRSTCAASAERTRRTPSRAPVPRRRSWAPCSSRG